MIAYMKQEQCGKTLIVHFTDRDLIVVPLDKIDRMQLSEPPRTVSDLLLDAELIARRIEQHESREAARQTAEEELQ